MKLRIKGNSIRLRLTQREIGQVGAGQTVREEVCFATGLFAYALLTDPNIEVPDAGFREGELRVRLPADLAARWAFSDQVGIETQVAGRDGHALHLLIEKDFQCLHKRPGEDESDHFKNPAATEA
ncbi:MAG TPA: hypothetical protein VF646_09795 [Cytophagales bacterium]|jgi:hypothetical protein